MSLLSQFPKGWRTRHVSEVIEMGDLKPHGIDWIPVDESDVGTQVMGKRDTPTGEIELVITPRKRRLSAAQKTVILERRRVGLHLDSTTA